MPTKLRFPCCACCRSTNHDPSIVHTFPCPQHQSWKKHGEPYDPENQSTDPSEGESRGE